MKQRNSYTPHNTLHYLEDQIKRFPFKPQNMSIQGLFLIIKNYVISFPSFFCFKNHGLLKTGLIKKIYSVHFCANRRNDSYDKYLLSYRKKAR